MDLHLGVGGDGLGKPHRGVVPVEHVVPRLATVGGFHQQPAVLLHCQGADRLGRVGQVKGLEIPGRQAEGVGCGSLLGRGQAQVDVLVRPGGVDGQRQSALQHESVLLELLQSVAGLDAQRPVHLKAVAMLDDQLARGGANDAEHGHFELGRHIQPELGRRERQRRLAIQLRPQGVVEQVGPDTTRDDHLESGRGGNRGRRIDTRLTRHRVDVLGAVRIRHAHRLALSGRRLQRQRVARHRERIGAQRGPSDGHSGGRALQDRVVERHRGGVGAHGEGLRVGAGDIVPRLDHLRGQPVSGIIGEAEVQHAVQADAALAAGGLPRQVEQEEEPARALGHVGEIGVEVGVHRHGVGEDRLARQQDLAGDVDLQIHLGPERLLRGVGAVESGSGRDDHVLGEVVEADPGASGALRNSSNLLAQVLLPLRRGHGGGVVGGREFPQAEGALFDVDLG